MPFLKTILSTIKVNFGQFSEEGEFFGLTTIYSMLTTFAKYSNSTNSACFYLYVSSNWLDVEIFVNYSHVNASYLICDCTDFFLCVNKQP
jgi:hypothetical protein